MVVYDVNVTGQPYIGIKRDVQVMRRDISVPVSWHFKHVYS